VWGPMCCSPYLARPPRSLASSFRVQRAPRSWLAGPACFRWPKPATVGLVVIAPLVPKLAARFGCRQVIGVGFAITAGGFAAVGFVQPSWRYLAFLLPVIAIAVGMGMSNGPASSAATASVSAEQVGAASGVSNMARYIGAAVATALAATIYATVTANRTAAGKTASEALSAGLALASWVMAAFSFAGVLMALVMARYRAAKGTVHDSAAAAAAHTHTPHLGDTARGAGS
jgi:MFS family permease